MKMREKLKSNSPDLKSDNTGKDDPNQYPLYPVSEDIYNKFKEEKDLDPEDISKVKKSGRDYDVVSDIDKEIDDDLSGSNLDIPGSELDDEQEITGNEDEENNYYSLGGDDHNDLDEDNGE